MDCYNNSDKYHTTKEGLKETLSKYGVAIIPSVLNDQETQEMRDGMWEYLEKVTEQFDAPIKRNDHKSWRNLQKLFPLHSMLIQHWAVGQSQFVWNLRQNPKLVEIFSHFWNTPAEDLLVSFDGASFAMPPEKTNLGWYRNVEKLHTDQSYLRNEFECMQSWVTGFDVNPGDATLRFLEGSHAVHKKFGEVHSKKDKDDWYKLTEEEIEWYVSQGCERKCITCPVGSMVFWDSRTIHCGQEPMRQRAAPNFRCVVYLCYVPRTLATEANLTKKRKAFEEMRMTTHYPQKVKLFSKTPRTYGSKLETITAIPKPVLNALGMRLAGY